jgi:transcriptional regulator with XRE-family HTH domain
MSEKLIKAVGDILKQKRKEQRLTQVELGEKVGKPQSYVARVENGGTDVQLSVIYEIISGLGLSLPEFFGDVEVAAGLSQSCETGGPRDLEQVFERVGALPESERIWVQGLIEHVLQRY